jgi:hypothetical protein
MIATPEEVGFTTLVAETLTLDGIAIDCGAVYKPSLETVPRGGLRDQLTLVSAVPQTVADNRTV